MVELNIRLPGNSFGALLLSIVLYIFFIILFTYFMVTWTILYWLCLYFDTMMRMNTSIQQNIPLISGQYSSYSSPFFLPSPIVLLVYKY